MAKAMTTQKTVTPSADGIAASVKAARTRGTPPVHLWDPPFSGDMDMRIARDGTWYYQGSPINRPAMVRLFSSILKREGDRFYLVTPVEKYAITVEDTPFLAVDIAARGAGRDQVLTFTTHVGDVTEAGPDHPIRVERDPATDTPSPYVMIRRGLEARIDRKSFYRMVDLGTEQGGWFGVWSSGVFFPIAPADEANSE